jgi:hypothetical protein
VGHVAAAGALHGLTADAYPWGFVGLRESCLLNRKSVPLWELLRYEGISATELCLR